MRKMRMSLMAAGLALAFVTGFMTDARAGIRVAATISTPEVRVHIGNGPSYQHYRHEVRRLPYRRYMRYEITRRDRMIARRMTWYTGVRMGELIRLRRHGYNWLEIGRWLDVPRRVVRAAMNQRSWDRFLREERRHARRHGKRKHRVAYYDGYYYDGYEYRGR
jgi:hypothetical protein